MYVCLYVCMLCMYVCMWVQIMLNLLADAPSLEKQLPASPTRLQSKGARLGHSL